MINLNMPTVEGAKGAKPVLVFPSAEAPEGLQVQVLDAGDGQVVEAGDHIVCARNCFGSTLFMFNNTLTQFSISTTLVELII